MNMEYTGRGDPTRRMELLWGRGERTSRGPRPGLSVEQIARAAIDVADTEGLEALSMRCIAERLGVTTMALYRYVPSKAELLDVMVDTVVGEVAKADTTEGGWRAAMELYAREDWALYHRHPWVLQVARSRPPLGPNVLAVYDAALRAVSGLGLTAQEMVAVVDLVSEYVQGAARNSTNAMLVAQDSGMSDEEWWAAQWSCLQKVFDSNRYPTLTKLVHRGGFDEPDARARAQANFEFGLQRVLDGIEVFIQRRQAGLDQV